MRTSSRAPAALLAALLLAACAGEPDTPAGLYRAHCARCHSMDGRGGPKARTEPGLDLIASRMAAAGDREAIRNRIARGKGRMPGFSKRLTPAETEQLVGYTLELHREAR